MKKHFPIVSTKAAILAVLAKNGEEYGSRLIKQVFKITDGRVRLEDGSVYPALLDLEKKKLIRGYDWKSGHGGRPRRYYSLSSKGKSMALEARRAIGALFGFYGAGRG